MADCSAEPGPTTAGKLAPAAHDRLPAQALSHPDNLRFTPGGDLLVLEDNGSNLGRQPATGGVNELYLLGKGRGEPRLFAMVRQEGGEPTGPWFHPNGRILYLSIQADPGRILAVRGPWTHRP